MDKVEAVETWFENERVHVIRTHESVLLRAPGASGRMAYALHAAAHWLDEVLGGVTPADGAWHIALTADPKQRAMAAAHLADAMLRATGRDPFGVLGEWTQRPGALRALSSWPSENGRDADAEEATATPARVGGDAERATRTRRGRGFERIGAPDERGPKLPAQGDPPPAGPEPNEAAAQAPEAAAPAATRAPELAAPPTRPTAEGGGSGPLPLASDPRSFALYLQDAGEERARTAQLLAAVAALTQDEASALVAAAPVRLPGTYDARAVRRIAVAVGAGAGADFRAEALDE